MYLAQEHFTIFEQAHPFVYGSYNSFVSVRLSSLVRLRYLVMCYQ